MPRVALHPSHTMAELLRNKRRELGLTLREVQQRSAELGELIPFSTLARVEQGKIDPGVRRLHLLLKLYGVSPQFAGDMLDLELIGGGETPEGSARQLNTRGVELWKKGRTREALAHLFAIRQKVTKSSRDRLERQKALLMFAMAAAGLGKLRLAREIVDGLLEEGPHPDLLVNVLIEAGSIWRYLGSPEAALAYFDRAERRAAPDAWQHRAWIAHNRASSLMDLGDLQTASASLRDARAWFRKAGDEFGQSQLFATEIKLALTQNDTAGALRLARQAIADAREHGFERLELLRQIDEARTLLLLDDLQGAVKVLNRAIARAAESEEQVALFYGHYYAWKAYQKLRDGGRAELELRNAQYFARAVDDVGPEIDEIRALDRSSRRRRPAARAAT